jgi:hypothetical protein
MAEPVKQNTLKGSDIRYWRRRCLVEVPELARKLSYGAQHFTRIENGLKYGRTEPKPVAVPKGIGPLVKAALLELLDARIDSLEQTKRELQAASVFDL